MSSHRQASHSRWGRRELSARSYLTGISCSQEEGLAPAVIGRAQALFPDQEALRDLKRNFALQNLIELLEIKRLHQVLSTTCIHR